MLIYGDQWEIADAGHKLDEVRASLGALAGLRPGLARHASLASALVEVGRLLQAVADADLDKYGAERRTRSTDALGSLALDLGHAAWTSWNSGMAAALPPIAVPPILELPREAELTVPEGYAFYAVYPEAFGDAAQRLQLEAEPRVIGIRSIGTSLAAIVAAALGAPGFATVRPVGDAFERRIRISPELEAELLAGDPHFIIVDEGPGLSGSSFGAVADWLGERGVPLCRIAFVTSHGGSPGPHASERHRGIWREVQRIAADIAAELAELLADWAAELLGPLDGPLIDLSGGAWRRWTHSHEGGWPAAAPLWERRKYLAFANGEAWLLKFAGLGRIGERKLALARQLHERNLVPEPVGLVHGFMAERWHGDARRLDPCERPLAAIARYMAGRRRALGEDGGEGASLGELLAMAERNLALVLGDEAAASAARWGPRLAMLERQVRAFSTDNRLLPHEWLELADGQMLKSDAVDHHAAHDLIGCQDLAWDVAGAIVEFGLDAREAGRLRQLLAQADAAVSGDLLEFYLVAYPAFRVGQVSVALESAGTGDERKRLQEQLSVYLDRAEQVLFGERLAIDSRQVPA